MKKFLFFALILLSFCRCTEEEKEPLALLGLQLNATDVELKVGQTYQFEVIPIPSNYPVDEYEWCVISFAGNGAGEISNTGLFTATKAGKVKVEVVTPNIKERGIPFFINTTVSIKGSTQEEKPNEDKDPVKINNIVFDEANVALKKGKSETISYTVQPSNADVSKLVWRVSDSSILSINTSVAGRITITALNTGKAEVYTVVDNKRYACQVSVEAVKVENITLNKSEVAIKQNETYNLVATVAPSDAEHTGLVYSSSDESVAEVSEKGLIKGKKPGDCVISVSTADKSVRAECKVTVLELPIKDLITVSMIAGSYSSFNGFVAADITLAFYNNSYKRVQVTNFKVYNTGSNRVIYEQDDYGNVENGEPLLISLQFSGVYRPLYVWEYECEGKMYKIVLQH